ncbi:hypothetical protein Trydic_g9554 [Trypoxylus dichotomus]
MVYRGSENPRSITVKVVILSANICDGGIVEPPFFNGAVAEPRCLELSKLTISLMCTQSDGEVEEITSTTQRILKSASTSSLSKEERSPISKLRKGKDRTMMFTDKRNTTVVMEIRDYKEEMRILYADTANARKIRRQLLKSTTTSRLYELPKTHKHGNLIRLTVSGVTHTLAKYLAKTVQPLVVKMETYIKNSAHFVEKLKNVKVKKNKAYRHIEKVVNTLKKFT